MKMKVVDQLHISQLGPNTMGKGTIFECSDALAADLEKRGLAVPVDKPAPVKKEKAPKNKSETAPKNK